MARKKKKKVSSKRTLRCFWMGRYVSDIFCNLEDAASAMKAGSDAAAQGHFGSVALAAKSVAKGLKGVGSAQAKLIGRQTAEIERKLAGRKRALRQDERQLLFRHAHVLRLAARTVSASSDTTCGGKERKSEVFKMPKIMPPVPSFGV